MVLGVQATDSGVFTTIKMFSRDSVAQDITAQRRLAPSASRVERPAAGKSFELVSWGAR